jgi:hypothetical protein
MSRLLTLDSRARVLIRSSSVFEATLAVAKEAGVTGKRRVLDSTSLYDAVATMDTITLIRSAIRGLLRVVAPALEVELKGVLRAGDDYASSAKPQIDWDDAEARETLIDNRAKDAYACLVLLDGEVLEPEVAKAVKLLARAVGQDLEEGADGVLRIARRVAPDRLAHRVAPRGSLGCLG